MSRHAWLTPESAPADYICRRVFIPNSVDWIAIVSGCLLDLIYPYNFEQYGTATPAETAAIFAVMFDEYSLDGMCRMIGEIIPYAGATSPDLRWLACDGASLLRADYPDLFAVIGASYGAADGSHFNLPDLQGRTIVGTGSGTGLTPRAIGDLFGQETHTLTTAEIAGHSHIDAGHSHVEGTAAPSLGAAIVGVPVPSAIPSAGVTGSGSANIGAAGGDGAHNNIQPSVAITYLIVALP